MLTISAFDVIGRIIFLIFLFMIPVGGVFLQIYLSKQESKWLGLILPIVTFGFSLLAVLNMVVYVELGTSTTSMYINGEWVTTTIEEGSREMIPGAIGGVIYTFVLMNIPTVILLAIYKSGRDKRNRHREVEKMSIQDL